MKATILCTDKNHPIIPLLKKWIKENSVKHDIDLIHDKSQISTGDILFLISCQELISANERMQYQSALLIHASDLPLGRGWSPHVWEIMSGSNELTVTLLKAEDKIDTGEIYKKLKIKIEPHELWDIINDKLFKAEIQLMNYAIESFSDLKGVKQDIQIKPTFFPKRTPRDSKIDPQKTIADQFNKIRVMDPIRYPAFFELNGFKYKITVKKLHE
tara:strand:+ start:1706 stop:2350 length:645 start_codon:yes stop_codon:yes gene_type:complete